MFSHYKSLLLFQLVSCQICFGQDILNPYSGYTVNGIPAANPPQNNVTAFPYNWIKAGIPPGYTGEYQIFLDYLFWESVYPNLAKSYSMEVISFPFTMDCAWLTNGCGSTSTFRNLYLPSDQYDNISKWGNLSRKTCDNCVFNVSKYQTLVSYGFTHDVPLDFIDHHVLPHSIIKHNIHLHCGNSINNPVIETISWIYDNTRGRMRYYPFSDDNNSNCGQASHDITFFPEVYSNQDNPHSYSESNNQFLINSGTINYFPFQNIPYPTNCAEVGTSTPLITEDFASGNGFGAPAAYNYVYPAPYSIVSAPARSYRGQFLAGLQWNSLTGQINYHPIPTENGIRHEYHIDKNIDLSIINNNEKIIYNPSEVIVEPTILANNFSINFPSYYKFRTIRGVHASDSDADFDNILDNGGPYTFRKDVPIRTDLRSENINEPQDPNNIRHSVYASMYYMKAGSQINIESCVGLFDMCFEVEDGATLYFLDYPQVYGKEDGSNFQAGRFKIRGAGGAVIRNYSDVQYVQNGNITQTTPLIYIATNEIVAGTLPPGQPYSNPDTDQPAGPYEIHNGANVTFKAGSQIHLTDGFSVDGGEFHALITPNIPAQVLCSINQFQGGGGGNRFSDSGNKPTIDSNEQLIVKPNPSYGTFNISFSDNTELNSIYIQNQMGSKVFDRVLNEMTTVEIDLSHLESGIYFISVHTKNGDVIFKKLIKL